MSVGGGGGVDTEISKAKSRRDEHVERIAPKDSAKL